MVNDSIRISKILKEFNIGISTLVEFLKKKGVEVEANPNGKVSEDVYALVKTEFGNEHDLKIASMKISWKPVTSGSISVSDIERDDDIDDEPEEEKEVFIKSNTVDIVIDDLPGPKIIGKLSDEQLSGKLHKKVEMQPPVNKTETQVPNKNVEPAKQQPVDTVKSAKPILVENVEKQQTSAEHQKPKEVIVTAKQHVEELKGPKIIHKIDIDSIVKPQKQEDKKQEDKKQEKNKAKEKNNQNQKDNRKDNRNQKERFTDNKKKLGKKQEPAKQAQPKMSKPAIQDKANQTVADLTGMEPRVEPEFIKTKVEQLSGPNVIGKIDLNQFKKTSDNKEKNKKKRKRIKKDAKVNVTAEINARKEHKDGYNNSGNNSGNNNNNRNNNNNNRNNNNNNRNNYNNNRNNNNNNNRSNNNNNNNANAGGNITNVRNRFKPVRRQVDDEAVQRQVKDTLARLTAGKGKTKSSKYRREKRDAVSLKAMEEKELQKIASNTLKVTEFVSVNELATMMDIPVVKVIGACMNLGLMVSINQRLDAEALVLVAEEFGYAVEFVTAELQDSIEVEADKDEDLQSRPPIITVMGHVDHGKTSLLDNIRKTNVIAGEAGGITQHIGAYSVELENGRKITFLDTPGHEAFTAMRARGAKITDVAIIIIAADDAVMPQTVEAINHAVAAGVPMIFAINKIDKPGANTEKIREQLANMNYLVEEWGGKYQSQEIAAKQGINVDKLLEKVLLEADLLDLKANPDKNAVGTVIESSLDKGRGYVTTLLVQNGTLRTGDVVLSGIYTGKVKAMFNERGKRLEEAGPATPVLILGLNGAPAAGETFNVMDDEREAREIANKREQLIRIQDIRTKKHITLEEIGRRIAIGSFKELNIVVKTDVDGSMEALSDSLIKLSTEEVQVNIIHRAVGAISESDVLLAAASNAIIIGFQVRPSAGARKLAEKEEIEIRLYSVIYDAINEVRDGIEGMLAPELKEEITATVEVLETFKITKVGTVAGCIVREGKIVRNSKVRIIRDGIVIYTGGLGSLKRFKEDVKDVVSGYECGLNIENFNDIKVGDMIEAYEQIEIKRKL
ncbi:MAG: translation initiation factor IF-2 [Prevotellaceae bacterium]|jgi:translation initiation factor IF-2|nr:translation initiation factor IF-2 [Prevotellaceae bacterium]